MVEVRKAVPYKVGPHFVSKVNLQLGELGFMEDRTIVAIVISCHGS